MKGGNTLCKKKEKGKRKGVGIKNRENSEKQVKGEERGK
jgi:hypothetical protein